MIYIAFFVISFLASVVGAICGIGGGVIIKPVLDAFGVMDVSAVSFLSGCTVLSMSTYSVVKSKQSKESHIEQKSGLPLAIGAAVGGLVGKWLFSFIKAIFSEPDKVGLVQAACLLLVTIGTLIYTIYKDRIKTHRITSILPCAVIGMLLGLLSSFLGIGGGPINLVVLFFCFSMSTKVAAENSLYIIFFSQIASLLSTILSGSVPKFQIGVLLLMIGGGIAGGVWGRSLNQKMSEKMVGRLFIYLMVVLILINIFNIYKFGIPSTVRVKF